MRRAIIYTRVSSDEQAEKGYSLQYQEEQLRKYCANRDITIVAHYREDFSAKTFDRPEFNKLMNFCKKNPGDVDYLLFINWSRFGRNAGDSYAIIKQLNKLEIEPQAIEQPLDLKVPENKMMLAFYLASPEVENDRRSINVKSGIYRAKKEGRWTTLAPIGYRNIRTEDGRAMIVPSKDANLVKEAFKEFATGAYGMEELRHKLFDKGLKIERARFPDLLRNKAYIGKVLVPAYKDEPEFYAKAIHEPLISEGLFYQVQDILEGRSPNRPTKNTLKEQLPLRGFLECRLCGKNISGSASRGNGGKYYYYHCTCGCNERFKAEIANKCFVEFLQSIKPNPMTLDLNYEILLEEFETRFRSDRTELNKIDEQIAKNNYRLQNAQSLMLDAEITASDYKEIKIKIVAANDDLLRKKANVSSSQEDFREHLKVGATLVRNIDGFYQNATLSEKQLIIGSVFPEKLIFEKDHFRTNRINEAVILMCMKHNDLDPKKSGRSKNFSLSSTQVEVRRFELPTPTSLTWCA
ncbi:MAG TPA: recombinase family protein, partial [Cyclobacteriaceae bacterium]|nr:recombinase family protein [Cyclobacteriaceae bacterium]